MPRYILNSPVITGPGTYEYLLVELSDAVGWIKAGGWVSTIGYAETAKVISDLAGVEVPLNRISIEMAPGDEALVFRLKKRLELPELKTKVSEEFVRANFESGILKKIK